MDGLTLWRFFFYSLFGSQIIFPSDFPFGSQSDLYSLLRNRVGRDKGADDNPYNSVLRVGKGLTRKKG